MSFCSIKNSPKYQRMEQCADTSNLQSLEILSRYYVDMYDYLPELDEINFLDSSNLLKDSLNVNKQMSVDLSEVFRYTGTNNINDAIVKLNTNLHPDLEIELYPTGKQALLSIRRRPKFTNIPNTEKDINISNIHHKKQVFEGMLYDLQHKLGIQFQYINNEELNSEKWVNLIPDSKLVNAFIYNGTIYINTDNASIEEPLHELSHILLGNLRYANPNIYYKLLDLVQHIPNIQDRLSEYFDRTMSDKLEEILVTEYSKYISNKSSLFDVINKSDLHKINYYMYRGLDTMLKGDYSSKVIIPSKLGNESLLSLGRKLHSNTLNNNKSDVVDHSIIHRIVNNQKSKLLKVGELIEEC